MKYIKQFLIILMVSCIGELFNILIPFPIPGSIYGMIILFVFLCCGFIKLSQIKETGDFFIDIMPLLFIPSAVGVISQIDQLKTIWIKVAIIVVATTIIVMGVTGIVTQFLIRRKRGKK